MARRKPQVLQEILSNQEEWDAFLSKGGLAVIDCHQQWCGPCKPVIGLFKRVKTELSSPLLHFATANCDTIKSLQPYRGNCEPCFHFYSGGELNGIIRGCNAPLIEATIKEKVDLEGKIQNGEAERVPFVDPKFQITETEEKNTEVNDAINAPPQVSKLVTIALIKPDLTAQDDKMNEIIAKIEENGLEIVADEEKHLSVEQVKDLYAHRADTENFDELVEFMTSGPVRVLGLTKGDTGEGVVDLWRSIIGPFDPEDAKKESKDSLRAKYGTTSVSNAVHGSSSADDAAKELAFFFPHFQPPPAVTPASVQATLEADDNEVFTDAAKPKTERTVAIIRPQDLKDNLEEILTEISAAGFQIVRKKEISLTQEQIEILYADHKDADHYQALVEHMTSGPSLILCLARDNAVAAWKEKLQPKVTQLSNSQTFGSHSVGDLTSLNEGKLETAEKMLFAEETLAIIKPDAAEKSHDIIKHLEGCGFTVKEAHDVQLSSDIASKIYSGKSGEDFFEDLVEHMTSGTCKVLVLSEVDAVEKLRQEIGNFDPNTAQTEEPNSIRSKFASSIIKNAIHAPSTLADFELEYKLLL